ncbi:MAG: hypothetical protein GWP08_04420 [Nitrospiraceae bacterium]|nr:hypothetical protein [Nitrospiraceae bacterium]
MRRDFKGGGRLQFERDLMAEIAGPSSPRRYAGRFARVVFFLAIVVSVLAIAAYGAVRFSFWPGRWVPLVRTCEALGEALRSGDMAGALRYCADSPEGRLVLAQDNGRVWNGNGEPEARGESRSSAEFLAATRETLLGQAADLADLRLLAFGGARATILDPDRMDESVVALTGDLFFAVGGKVYALELTLRECAGQYVVTDFWKCAPVDATPDMIEPAAASRFRAFLEEEAKQGESAEIRRAKRVFVTLDTE